MHFSFPTQNRALKDPLAQLALLETEDRMVTLVMMVLLDHLVLQ